LLFENARAFDDGGSSGPDFKSVETAVAGFNLGHPYLLCYESAITRIRRHSLGNIQLQLRLSKYLATSCPGASEQERRAVIKRQARRLINTAFLALIGDGPKKTEALQATRTALTGFTSMTTWKERPAIKSFLDCAEIAVAVSLAYDWLYSDLSPEERQAVELSLFRHVLEPGLAAYGDRLSLWPQRRDNCTIVSNSGILIAALAVLQCYPNLSVTLVQNSLASAWNAFEAFAPDGVWPEGLSYWSLAVRYAGLMVAALESTLGDSFGLADRSGFAQTGDFALHAVGPSGVAFDFGDSERRFDVSPLAWFAYRYRRPVDARLAAAPAGWSLPLTTIWSTRPRPGTGRPRACNPPTGKIFHGSDLACFRNTWSSEPEARPVYLAIKGGNAVGQREVARPEDVMLHTQADAGTFIVDGARQRWIIDLGPDDYNLPGYFDHGTRNGAGSRWRYYRAQTAGHNTLVIDGVNQIPDTPAPILGGCVDGHSKWAVFDLSAAYGRPAGSVRRGAALIGRQVVIQDEISPGIGGSIVWAAHTSADPVSIEGCVARFRLGDDRFVARILEPSSACFELTLPPAPRSFPIADIRQLHGPLTAAGDRALVSELPRRVDEEGKRAAGALIRRLEIVWPSGARRLTVLLLPDCDDDELALPVTSLDDWLARRPVRLARYPQPVIAQLPPKPVRERRSRIAR
jgi:Heparinase II/III-like protein